jgi:hypothetical protein
MIRFDPESRRVLDDKNGEYLENEFHHYQDPLHHYWLRSEQGEPQSSADVALKCIDTTGDMKVDRIEATVFRIFSLRHDGKMTRVWSSWHPAARRFMAFYKMHLRNLQTNSPRVVVSYRLWSRLPQSDR